MRMKKIPPMGVFSTKKIPPMSEEKMEIEIEIDLSISISILFCVSPPLRGGEL